MGWVDPCRGDGSLPWAGAALPPRPPRAAPGSAQVSALPCGCAAAKALPLPIRSGPIRPWEPPRPLLGLQRAPTLAGTEGQPGPLPTPVGDELLLKHLAVHRNRSPPLITIIHHPALGRGCARFSRAGELLGLEGGFWGDTEASAPVVASLLHCPPHTHPASSWGLCKS